MATHDFHPDTSHRQLLEEFYDRLQEVFGFRPETVPEVFIVSDKISFDALAGRTSADWEIGSAKDDAIYFLDITAICSTEAHKDFSAEDLPDAIRHEAAHIYFNALTDAPDDRKIPRWLSEGLATYWSGQQEKRKTVESFEHLNDTDEAFAKYLYDEGGTAVQLLMDNFGVKKLKGMLHRLVLESDVSDFQSIFSNVYGFFPNNEEFNRLLSGR